MNTEARNTEARELTTDELELVSGGTIIIEEAAPMPYPPGPSAKAPFEPN